MIWGRLKGWARGQRRFYLWSEWQVQDPQTGEIVYQNRPPVRLLVRAIKSHWLAHWKFWLNFLVAWTVAVVAVATYVGSCP